jgi:hypothetical protein
MKIQCTDRKTFVLIDESKKLGQLFYEGVFTFKAQAMIGDDHYEFTPVGFFSTTIDVTARGKKIATMAMSWKGHIIISLEDGREYRLMATGPFLNKYVLEDQNHQKLMLFDPDLQWAKFSYSFSISYEEKPDEIFLVLLATYAAIFFMAGNSGEG